MLKSKIHRATVTEANLEYEGSITIDAGLLEASDILPFERVEVYNIDNGERFATYAITGPMGSGVICVNGAAAHLVRPGHKVIIASYVQVVDSEIASLRQRIILVDEKNRPKAK